MTLKNLLPILSVFMGLIITSCEGQDIVPAPQEEDPTDPLSSTYYIRGTINGDLVDHNDGIQNYQVINSTSPGIDAVNDNINMDMGSGVMDIDQSPQNNGFVSINNYNMGLSAYSSNKQAAMETMLAIGNKTYAVDADNGGEGWKVYFSIDGEVWSSDKGAQESEALFAIASFTHLGNSGGDEYYNATGTFSCKLYNEAGDFKTVSNGEFKLNFSSP